MARLVFESSLEAAKVIWRAEKLAFVEEVIRDLGCISKKLRVLAKNLHHYQEIIRDCLFDRICAVVKHLHD